VKPAALNASPVIILARAGYFELLPQIFDPIVVPQAVVDEINAGSAFDPAISALAHADWLKVVDLTPIVSPIATWRLGGGETEVLEYGRRNSGVVAVLDDKAARRAAAFFGVPVIGTLGVLAAAVSSGLLPDFGVAVEAVTRAGLFVDPFTVQTLKDKLRRSDPDPKV
jgi:predicted nucleic acid-binding protein